MAHPVFHGSAFKGLIGWWLSQLTHLHCPDINFCLDSLIFFFTLFITGNTKQHKILISETLKLCMQQIVNYTILFLQALAPILQFRVTIDWVTG